MGLDTFASAKGPDGEWHAAPDQPFAGLRLVGGMYSGGQGSSSMRGKVYDEVVLEATGESLYQALIEPATVAEMARRLRAAVEEAKRAGTHAAQRRVGSLDEEGQFAMATEDLTAFDVGGVEIDAAEAEDLARWFEVCAENGYAVQGWW